MPRSRTIDALREDVLQVADIDAIDFSSNGELDRYINRAGARLHSRLAVKMGRQYLHAETSVSTVADTPTIDLGVDAAHISFVDRDGVYPEGYPIRLGSSEMRFRTGEWCAEGVHYLPENMSSDTQRIRLFPTPTAVHALTIGYVPAWAELSGTDLLWLPEDWHDWIVHTVAIRYMTKERTDTSDSRESLAEIEMDMERAFSELVQGEPFRVSLSPTDPWDSTVY